MARDPDHLAGFDAENTGGVLSGFLAEEDVFDRRTLWRLGSWGAASVGAVILALYASQSSISHAARPGRGGRSGTASAANSVGRQGKPERDPAAGIRHRYAERRSRPAVLPGHRAGTGSGFRDRRDCQSKALPQRRRKPLPPLRAVAATAEPQATPQNPAAAPAVSPVATTSAKAADKPPVDASVAEQGPATVSSVAQKASKTPPATPATPLVASKSMMAPPDAAAGKLIEPEKPANVPAAAPAPETVASVSSD